jgi:WD40 repeat protein
MTGRIHFGPQKRFLLASDGKSDCLVFDSHEFGAPRRLIGCLVRNSPVLFSADGSAVLVRGLDGNLDQWDLESGMRTLSVDCALAIGDTQASLRLVQSTESLLVASRRGEREFPGVYMDIAPDGQHVITQTSSKQFATRTPQQQSVTSSDVWSDAQREVSVWNTATGNSVLVMRDVSFAWFANAETLLAVQRVGDDYSSGEVRVTIRRGKEFEIVQNSPVPNGMLVVGPSGMTFLVVNENGTIRLWTVNANGTISQGRVIYEACINGTVQISGSDRLIVCLQINLQRKKSQILLFDSASGRPLRRLGNPSDVAMLTCLAISPDESVILAADTNGGVWSWDVKEVNRN